MSALNRGITLARALGSILSDATETRDEPRYALSEIIHRLYEQGWKVERDDHAMPMPRLVQEPYVLATFETLCGCRKQMFMPAPPPPEFKVPYFNAPLFSNGPGATSATFNASFRTFRLYQRTNWNQVVYREVVS